MPYIKTEEKEVWDKFMAETLKYVAKPGFATAGDLNYLMTKLAQAFVKAGGRNYHNLNSIVGVFESAKAEFQRRVVAPYEDEKIEENGDVYESKPKATVKVDQNGNLLDYQVNGTIDRLRKS